LTSDVLSLALRARKRVQIRSRRICHRAYARLRFTSVEKRPGRWISVSISTALGLAYQRFSTEVKRSEASHEGEKCCGRPTHVSIGTIVGHLPEDGQAARDVVTYVHHV